MEQKSFRDGGYISSILRIPFTIKVFHPPNSTNFSVQGLTFNFENESSCIVGKFKKPSDNKTHGFNFSVAHTTPRMIELRRTYGTTDSVVIY